MDGSKLDSLRRLSVIVADSGDIEAVRALAPQDCTTNPTLVLKASGMPQYQSIVDHALERAAAEPGSPSDRAERTLDHLAVAFGAELTGIVPGYVSTEVDARLSFDTGATIAKAERLVELYRTYGVDPGRILIKVAGTWEGIRAVETLEKRGVRCNVTLIFALAQAVAAAEGGAFLISPFVGRILDWHVKAAGRSFAIDEDPGVSSVRDIYHYFKQFGHETVVMGASFRSQEQVEALAGCDRLTVSPALLEKLAAEAGETPRALPVEGAPSFERLDVSEPSFRWLLNENQMATEKLAEGIRSFHADTVALRARIGELVAAHA